MWGLLGMLDMNQLLQEAADDSESTSTGTDPSPSSPPQVYPSMQQVQVQFQGSLRFIHTCDLLGVYYCMYFSAMHHKKIGTQPKIFPTESNKPTIS